VTRGWHELFFSVTFTDFLKDLPGICNSIEPAISKEIQF
jgi:hypothetical protein